MQAHMKHKRADWKLSPEFIGEVASVQYPSNGIDLTDEVQTMG